MYRIVCWNNMKWYEIIGIVTIIGILGITVLLGINPNKDEILVEVPITCGPGTHLIDRICVRNIDTRGPMEQEPELIEDSHKIKITGKYAEAICEIAQIPCPENVEFEGLL